MVNDLKFHIPILRNNTFYANSAETRSDCLLGAVWSGSKLFAFYQVFCEMNTHKKKQHNLVKKRKE